MAASSTRPPRVRALLPLATIMPISRRPDAAQPKSSSAMDLLVTRERARDARAGGAAPRMLLPSSMSLCSELRMPAEAIVGACRLSGSPFPDPAVAGAQLQKEGGQERGRRLEGRRK
eukprot:766272-Hanusia_phi.AAC.2